MIHNVLIITGFIQIAVGLCVWCNTHQIKAEYRTTITEVLADDGTKHSEYNWGTVFEQYRLVKRGSRNEQTG